MNVHIIKTPEYDVENYGKVMGLLNSIPGPLNFIRTSFEFNKDEYYFLGYELFPDHPFNFPSNETKVKFKLGFDDPLSWNELFVLCNSYRETFHIEENDFIVLLTDRKNATNWFSISDANKNIFVVTSEWDEYTTLSREFPIVHQIVENIFQVLMGLDVRGESPFIHKVLRGCINDFCEDKYQVIAKLKSGAICEDCTREIRSKISDIQVAKHLKKYLNLVRDAYDIDFFDLPISNLSPISVRRNRATNLNELVFHTYNKTLVIYPLEMTLYVFYLKYGGMDGIKKRDLKEELNINRLVDIYLQISPYLERKDALFTINGLTTKYFSVHKSSLIRKIESALINDRISEKYVIAGNPGERFKVQIPRDLVSIQY